MKWQAAAKAKSAMFKILLFASFFLSWLYDGKYTLDLQVVLKEQSSPLSQSISLYSWRKQKQAALLKAGMGYGQGDLQQHWASPPGRGGVLQHASPNLHPSVNQASCYLNFFNLIGLECVLINLLDSSLCHLKSDSNTPWVFPAVLQFFCAIQSESPTQQHKAALPVNQQRKIKKTKGFQKYTFCFPLHRWDIDFSSNILIRACSDNTKGNGLKENRF